MYGCETAKFLLERGIISIDNIDSCYEATGTLEPGYFRPIIQRFDELARGHNDKDLAKQLPNQLVGVFLIARNFSYQLLQGECHDEICSLGNGIQDAKCRWVDGLAKGRGGSLRPSSPMRSSPAPRSCPSGIM